MWWFFFVFFVIGSTSAKSITLHNVTLSSDYTIEAGDLMKNVTKSIVKFDESLDEYINWVDFDKMFEDMQSHDGPYSLWGLGDVRKYFLQSKDYYFLSVTSIYEWCGQISILMNAYIDLFNDYEEDVKNDQIEIIKNVLDEGINRTTEALENLDKSRDNLNTGVVALTNLMSNLSEIFKKDQSEHENKMHQLNQHALNGFGSSLIAGVINLIIVETKYKPDLEATFEKFKSSFDFMRKKLLTSIAEADKIRLKLLAEIQNIVELRAAAKSNKVTINFKTKRVMVKAANTLITLCTDYQKKHGLKV